MNTVVVSFASHGPFLGTRHLGEGVRKEILQALDVGSPVVILDFSNVEGMSQSFADECIGKLLVQIGKSKFRGNIRFKAASSSITPVLKLVISQRSATLEPEFHERTV
jgi:hypothetical protein